MTITIRAAEERDLDLLVGMNRAVHGMHVAAAPGFFRQPDAAAVGELFRSRLERPDVCSWIATVDEEPAGYAVAAVHERQENALCLARRWVELEEIGVAPAHRQQGVARALVERVLAEARAHGIADVELVTWSFNATAQAAFAALGFRPMTMRLQRGSG